MEVWVLNVVMLAMVGVWILACVSGILRYVPLRAVLYSSVVGAASSIGLGICDLRGGTCPEVVVWLLPAVYVSMFTCPWLAIVAAKNEKRVSEGRKVLVVLVIFVLAFVHFIGTVPLFAR